MSEAPSVTLPTCCDSLCSNVFLVIVVFLPGAHFPMLKFRTSLDVSDYTAATIDTCPRLVRIMSVANIFIMPAASGLFFIRLIAVYVHDKYAMVFFGSCWLVILVFFVFDSTQTLIRLPSVTRSSGCITVKHNDAWGYLATAIYDTLMYVAISWRLSSFATLSGWRNRVRSLVTGNGLGWLPKVLLQSGQVYYS